VDNNFIRDISDMLRNTDAD